MIDKIIDELVESISKMVCESKVAPLDFKAMSMLSILSSKLVPFGEKVNGCSVLERQKYGDKFENIIKCAEKLIGALDECMAVLPHSKESVESESFDKNEDEETDSEDKFELRFLGKRE